MGRRNTTTTEPTPITQDNFTRVISDLNDYFPYVSYKALLKAVSEHDTVKQVAQYFRDRPELTKAPSTTTAANGDSKKSPIEEEGEEPSRGEDGEDEISWNDDALSDEVKSEEVEREAIIDQNANTPGHKPQPVKPTQSKAPGKDQSQSFPQSEDDDPLDCECPECKLIPEDGDDEFESSAIFISQHFNEVPVSIAFQYLEASNLDIKRTIEILIGKGYKLKPGVPGHIKKTTPLGKKDKELPRDRNATPISTPLSTAVTKLSTPIPAPKTNGHLQESSCIDEIEWEDNDTTGDFEDSQEPSSKSQVKRKPASSSRDKPQEKKFTKISPKVDFFINLEVYDSLLDMFPELTYKQVKTHFFHNQSDLFNARISLVKLVEQNLKNSPKPAVKSTTFSSHQVPKRSLPTPAAKLSVDSQKVEAMIEEYQEIPSDHIKHLLDDNKHNLEVVEKIIYAGRKKEKKNKEHKSDVDGTNTAAKEVKISRPINGDAGSSSDIPEFDQTVDVNEVERLSKIIPVKRGESESEFDDHEEFHSPANEYAELAYPVKKEVPTIPEKFPSRPQTPVQRSPFIPKAVQTAAPTSTPSSRNVVLNNDHKEDNYYYDDYDNQDDKDEKYEEAYDQDESDDGFNHIEQTMRSRLDNLTVQEPIYHTPTPEPQFDSLTSSLNPKHYAPSMNIFGNGCQGSVAPSGGSIWNPISPQTGAGSQNDFGAMNNSIKASWSSQTPLTHPTFGNDGQTLLSSSENTPISQAAQQPLFQPQLQQKCFSLSDQLGSNCFLSDNSVSSVNQGSSLFPAVMRSDSLVGLQSPSFGGNAKNVSPFGSSANLLVQQQPQQAPPQIPSPAGFDSGLPSQISTPAVGANVTASQYDTLGFGFLAGSPASLIDQGNISCAMGSPFPRSGSIGSALVPSVTTYDDSDNGAINPSLTVPADSFPQNNESSDLTISHKVDSLLNMFPNIPMDEIELYLVQNNEDFDQTMDVLLNYEELSKLKEQETQAQAQQTQDDEDRLWETVKSQQLEFESAEIEEYGSLIAGLDDLEAAGEGANIDTITVLTELTTDEVIPYYNKNGKDINATLVDIVEDYNLKLEKKVKELKQKKKIIISELPSKFKIPKGGRVQNMPNFSMPVREREAIDAKMKKSSGEFSYQYDDSSDEVKALQDILKANQSLTEIYWEFYVKLMKFFAGDHYKVISYALYLLEHDGVPHTLITSYNTAANSSASSRTLSSRAFTSSKPKITAANLFRAAPVIATKASASSSSAKVVEGLTKKALEKDLDDEQIFLQREQLRKAHTGQIDLHGFIVINAKVTAKKVLKDWWSEEKRLREQHGILTYGKNANFVEPLDIVTGRGLHNDGFSKVKNAIGTLLRKEKYVYEELVGRYHVTGYKGD